MPAGLQPGMQFVAVVPNMGRMLVTVPYGATAGQVVAIQVPDSASGPAASQPAGSADTPPAARYQVPVATRDAAAPAAAADTPTPAAAGGHSGSEHPNAAAMLDGALEEHYEQA